MPLGGKRKGKMNRNYKPRLLRTTVEPTFVFRAVSGKYPSARAGKLQQKEGECKVRPTFCFRPKDGQVEAATYPVRIRVYQMPDGRLHGVAEPLPEAQLTRDELLDIQQIKREIVFRGSERRDGTSGLVAEDEATGMKIVPAGYWKELTGKEPEPSERYTVLLEEYPNKFVAHPVKLGISDEESTSTALALATESGMLTLHHQLHVVSADGKRWISFREALWLDEDFKEEDVRRQFRKLAGSAHPDKKASATGTFAETMRKLAEAKMRCLKEARDKALDWLAGCPAILKTGERKGKRCGAKRAEASTCCARHLSGAGVEQAIADGMGSSIVVKSPAPQPVLAPETSVPAPQVAVASPPPASTGNGVTEEQVKDLVAGNGWATARPNGTGSGLLSPNGQPVSAS